VIGRILPKDIIPDFETIVEEIALRERAFHVHAEAFHNEERRPTKSYGRSGVHRTVTLGDILRLKATHQHHKRRDMKVTLYQTSAQSPERAKQVLRDIEHEFLIGLGNIKVIGFRLTYSEVKSGDIPIRKLFSKTRRYRELNIRCSAWYLPSHNCMGVRLTHIFIDIVGSQRWYRDILLL
jgi:hypothetical protein